MHSKAFSYTAILVFYVISLYQLTSTHLLSLLRFSCLAQVIKGYSLMEGSHTQRVVIETLKYDF